MTILNHVISTKLQGERVILFLLLFVWNLSLVKAQKQCVIASAENHVPIREALIHTDNDHWARTDYRGYWNMKYQFDSATVSKQGFLKTTIYLKNLPDTVFLLPESQQIGTVEVWGKNQQHIQEMERQADDAAKNLLQKPSGLSFDLSNMLDARGRRDRKHLKKARILMDGLEKKDPIISAYEKETGKKYQLKPPHGQEQERRDSTLVETKGKYIIK